jgi:hypothetical protein
MTPVDMPHTRRLLRMKGLLLAGWFALIVMPVMMIADTPIASSNFVGAENPLSENGTWVSVMAYSPYGTVFQKNNGAFLDRLSALNHGAAHTTAVVPPDHYSEIVVGHVATTSNNVGAIVRVQTSGAASDSLYLWWASLAGGGNYLYRLDSHIPDPSRPTTYTANALVPSSPVVDGDRLRLIARGSVIYGLKNGVRDFIYNTATNVINYTGGSTGIMAYADGALNNAIISSWSTGAAPVSSGTWTSTTFAGTENPLDEGDRWYPLPGYLGFRKAGGAVIGLNANHNASGVWSIAPPQKQYSEVTLNTVSSGGGGPVVRIDRTNAGQTGWLLFLYPDSLSSSGIYKMTPDGNFAATQLFTPTLVPGDKWRLAADGNVLEVFRNGVSQFTYTTDGSYPTGDVGIEAFTQAFTFRAWEGGDAAGGAQAPTITSFTPTSGTSGTSVTISGTNLTGATAVTFNGASAAFTAASGTSIQATVPNGATTGPLSVTTPRGTATSASAFTVTPSAPTITGFTPASGPVGTSVTINGTNFTGATAVQFNGVSAAFTATSDTAIQTTVPAGATTGPVSVTTAGGTATSAGNFAVTGVLTATKAGTGSGTISSTSTPASADQINCGATCSASYDTGTVVTLTATSDAGSTFTIWTGCDAVAGATCTVTINASRSVTATFTLQRFVLTAKKVSTLGLGNGTITSTSSPASPDQVNCGAGCAQIAVSYDYNTVVTLTAVPDATSVFGYWCGCDSVSDNVCTVRMAYSRSATANFLP